MAPYAIAHLKLGLQLQDLGYQFTSKQRLGIYLTTTLDEALKKSEVLFGQFVATEANEASAIKRDVPVMVILGDPPYSGHSVNKSEWIAVHAKEMNPHGKSVEKLLSKPGIMLNKEAQAALREVRCELGSEKLGD